MSRIIEIEPILEEKEEIKEEPIINDLNTDTATKQEDSTNTLESNKQSNNTHKNDKLGIVKWLLECLINILKNIVEKM